MSECPKCEDRERMEEILKAINNGSNHITKQRYETIKKFVKQLKDCLEEMKRFEETMLNDLSKCEGKDIYKDSDEIGNNLKHLIDYALLEKSNMEIVLETLKILLGELYWTTN